MRKEQELSDPSSCLNKSKPGEMLFVLLGRDVAAPEAIRRWVNDRVSMGKNGFDDAQIIEALACADQMELDQKNPTE